MYKIRISIHEDVDVEDIPQELWDMRGVVEVSTLEEYFNLLDRIDKLTGGFYSICNNGMWVIIE